MTLWDFLFAGGIPALLQSIVNAILALLFPTAGA